MEGSKWQKADEDAVGLVRTRRITAGTVDGSRGGACGWGRGVRFRDVV